MNMVYLIELQILIHLKALLITKWTKDYWLLAQGMFREDYKTKHKKYKY